MEKEAREWVGWTADSGSEGKGRRNITTGRKHNHTVCLAENAETSKSLSLAKFSFLVTEADAVGTLEN